MKTKTPKLPVPLESEILRGVLDLLKAMNIPASRSNAGGGYRLGKGGKPQLIRGAPKGWLDITGWMPCRRGPGLPTELDGRFLGIETKRPRERPDEHQIATMRNINRDGGVAFWTDDIEVCEVILRRVMSGWTVGVDEDGRVWMDDGETT